MIYLRKEDHFQLLDEERGTMFIPNRIRGTRDVPSVSEPIQAHFLTPAPSSNITVQQNSTMTQRSEGQSHSVNQSGISSSPTISFPTHNEMTSQSGNNTNPDRRREEVARNVPLATTLSQNEFYQNKTVVKSRSFIPTPTVPIPISATAKENKPTKNSTSNTKPSSSLSNSQSLHHTPSTLHKPFVLLSSSLISRIVIPPRKLSHFPTIPRSYVLESGIVFYVYATQGCRKGIKYMPQTLRNAKYIKEMDPTVSHGLLNHHYYYHF